VQTRSLVLTLCWLLGVACGGSADSAPDAAEDAAVDAGNDADLIPASVELGSGEVEYEPVDSEQHLKLHAGSQGGHHVWLSYRTRGLDRSIRMTLDVVPEGNARPAHSEVDLTLTAVASDADAYEFVGWPAQILDPECAVGSVVAIALTIKDKSGKQASGSLRVIPEPPDTGFTRTCTR
jgi:hypothetical protein